MSDFWRIMGELTKIGPKSFHCNNSACSQYLIYKLQDTLQDVKSCTECKEILVKGLIPKFNYVEKFKLTSDNFVKGNELQIEIVLAVPISKQESK